VSSQIDRRELGVKKAADLVKRSRDSNEAQDPVLEIVATSAIVLRTVPGERGTHNLEESNMKRKASAVWQGGLKGGKGTISTESGVLTKTQYSFGTRFENGPGTNPEELIAAAHAGCFSMALSAELEKAGVNPESIETSATVTLDKQDGGWAVTAVHLETVGKVAGNDAGKFKAAAESAKAGCPISKLLKANITLDARLQ
jgi:osmotically inducible protein OsmC